MSKIYSVGDFTIDAHMLSRLNAYIKKRQPVGGFLTAVLENNLEQAVSLADEVNIRNLPAFVGYLYNEAPSLCWGSKRAVKAWLGGAV